jgi:hypothetical protein
MLLNLLILPTRRFLTGSQDDRHDCPLGDVPWTDVRCAVIHFHPDLVASVVPLSDSQPCKEALESFYLEHRQQSRRTSEKYN